MGRCILHRPRRRSYEATEYSKMDLVYSRAFATIVAISDSHTGSSLPGLQPGSRTPLLSSTFPMSDCSATISLNSLSAQIDQITIAASPTPLTLAIASSTWNTRAWTYQEHLRSVRCIYIIANAIYCHFRQKTTLCETGKPESASVAGLSILNNPLHELQPIHTNLVDAMSGRTGDAVLRFVFRMYKTLVEGYSPRKMKFPGDVLKAFAGVFAVTERHMASGAT